MNLSIVLVHYKAPKFLSQCIKSITLKHPELEENFVIVDNSPSQKTSKWIKSSFPKARYIPSRENVGYAKAVNWGINNTVTDYVLILNQDIVVRNDALQKMMDYMNENHDIGVLAAKQTNQDSSIQYTCREFPTPGIIVFRRTFLGKFKSSKEKLSKFLMEKWDHSEVRDVDWVQGSCMLIRKKALKEVGLMDERFFFYFEDIDWCRRFWKKGWRVVYYPYAEMLHYYTRQSAEKIGFISLLNTMTRIHIRSGIKYFSKYRKAPKVSPRITFLKK